MEGNEDLPFCRRAAKRDCSSRELQHCFLLGPFFIPSLLPFTALSYFLSSRTFNSIFFLFLHSYLSFSHAHFSPAENLRPSALSGNLGRARESEYEWEGERGERIGICKHTWKPKCFIPRWAISITMTYVSGCSFQPPSPSPFSSPLVGHSAGEVELRACTMQVHDIHDSQLQLQLRQQVYACWTYSEIIFCAISYQIGRPT